MRLGAFRPKRALGCGGVWAPAVFLLWLLAGARQRERFCGAWRALAVVYLTERSDLTDRSEIRMSLQLLRVVPVFASAAP